MDKLTKTIEKRYNRVSRIYDLMDKPMDWITPESWRREILSGAYGITLEVGVGTGKNLKYYPEDVEITAIDFSEKMLEKARKKAMKIKNPPELHQMDVQELAFDDATFDYIFTTYVFCSVPDPVKGLEEIMRVLKPGGQLVMLEHVRSKNPLLGLMMDALNPIVVRLIGANINRKTVENIKRAGFDNITVEHSVGDVIKWIKVVR